MSFFHSTGGCKWKVNKGWNEESLPTSEWHGVVVDVKGRVVAIELSEVGLVGTLPRSMHVMTKLRRLDLRGNPGLIGHIPPSLAELRLLSELKLDGRKHHATGLTMPFTDLTIADYGFDPNRQSRENVEILCDQLTLVPLRSITFETPSSIGISWQQCKVAKVSGMAKSTVKEGWVAVAVDGVRLSNIDMDASSNIQIERSKNETVSAAALFARLEACSLGPGIETSFLGLNAPRTSTSVVIDFIGPAPWVYKREKEGTWCPFDRILGFKLEHHWVERDDPEVHLVKADTDVSGIEYKFDLVKLQQHRMNSNGTRSTTDREISRTDEALVVERGEGWPSLFSHQGTVTDTTKGNVNASESYPGSSTLGADPKRPSEETDSSFDLKSEVLPQTSSLCMQGGVIGGGKGGVGLALTAPPGALAPGTELSLSRAPLESSGNALNIVDIEVSGGPRELLLPVAMRMQHNCLIDDIDDDSRILVLTRASSIDSWVPASNANISDAYVDIVLSPGRIPLQVAIRASESPLLNAVALAFQLEEAQSQITSTAITIWVIPDRDDSRLRVAQRMNKLHPAGSWKMVAESVEPFLVNTSQSVSVEMDQNAQERGFKDRQGAVFQFQLEPGPLGGFARVIVTGDKIYGPIDFFISRSASVEPSHESESTLPQKPELLHRADGGVLTLCLRSEAREGDQDKRPLIVQVASLAVRDCISKNEGFTMPEAPSDASWVVACEGTSSTVTVQGGFASYIRSRYSNGRERDWSPVLAVPPPGNEALSSAGLSLPVEDSSEPSSLDMSLELRNELLTLLKPDITSTTFELDYNCRKLLHRASSAVSQALYHMGDKNLGESQALQLLVRKVRSMVTAASGEGWLSRVLMPEGGRAESFASIDAELYQAAARVIQTSYQSKGNHDSASVALETMRLSGGTMYEENLDLKLDLVRQGLCAALATTPEVEESEEAMAVMITRYLGVPFVEAAKEITNTRFQYSLQRLRSSAASTAFPLLPTHSAENQLMRVYVSYDSRQGISNVAEFVTALCRFVSCSTVRLVTRAGGDGGGKVLQRIRNDVKSCSAFIAVLSPGYGSALVSPWTARELEAADHGLIPILPIELSDAAHPSPCLATVATAHFDKTVDFREAVFQGLKSPAFAACAGVLCGLLGGPSTAIDLNFANGQVIDIADATAAANHDDGVTKDSASKTENIGKSDSATEKDTDGNELETWLASIRLLHALEPLRTLGVELLEDLAFIDDEDVCGLALRKVEYRRFDHARRKILKSAEGTVPCDSGSTMAPGDDTSDGGRPKAAHRLDNALAVTASSQSHCPLSPLLPALNWRAEVFGSMRFNATGPARAGGEARQLSTALEAQGVKLHVIDVAAGASITLKVFETMERCAAFIAFGTRDYGEVTGNPAATDQELAYWQGLMGQKTKSKGMATGKENGSELELMVPVPPRPLIPVRMIPFDDEFDNIAARVLFGVNSLSLFWPLENDLPEDTVGNILKVLGLPEMTTKEEEGAGDETTSI